MLSLRVSGETSWFQDKYSPWLVLNFYSLALGKLGMILYHLNPIVKATPIQSPASELLDIQCMSVATGGCFTQISFLLISPELRLHASLDCYSKNNL